VEYPTVTVQQTPTKPAHWWDWVWPFWPAVPLYPYSKRRTLRTEVVKNTIWTFDQIQGIVYVVTPIRMTVVKLNAGGLLVYAPVAPTPECIRLVRELEAAHGDVKYIILPTVSGIEHKVFVGPFARCFPKSQVFVAANQWSFPLNLPLSWLGFPPNRTQVLPALSQNLPFSDEFEIAILGPINLGIGPFEEVALCHKRSRTLLVTDSVVSIPAEPPAIVQLDPYPLLFHARDSAFEPIVDTPENRQKGWKRICLFAFYFRPSSLDVVEMGQSLRDALKAPNRSKPAYFGWYPFRWKENWQQSYQQLRGEGRLFVAPILQKLILNRAPRETITWANIVASWEFEQIIPCHFAAPVPADSRQFRQAFMFLEKAGTQVLPIEDFGLLEEIEAGLLKFGAVPVAKEKV
jgi:hypothetical protein